MYSVSIQEGDVTRLHHDLSMLGLEVLDMGISADASLVAFALGPLGGFNGLEIHTVPLTGGVVHRVSLPLEAGETLGGEFEFSDDANYMLYSRQKDGSDLVYFRTPARGGLAQRFTPNQIEVASSNTDPTWFSSEGSQ